MIDKIMNIDWSELDYTSIALGMGVFFILGGLGLIASIFNKNVFYMLSTVFRRIGVKIIAGSKVQEEKLLRNIHSGRRSEKALDYRFYNFVYNICNALYGSREISPYVFITIIMFASLGVGLIFAKLLLGSFWFVLILMPVAFVGFFAYFFTIANKRERGRINSELQAINTVCSNMKGGVVPAIKESLKSIDPTIRYMFEDLVVSVEDKNMHIVKALENLNSDLGEIGDDFIRKAITFETGEERGLVDVFKDVIEVNNMKIRMRQKQEDAFKKVEFDFKISTLGIFGFLFGVLAIYPDVRGWYFSTTLGSLILLADVLLLLAEYVYMTFLRARAF